MTGLEGGRDLLIPPQGTYTKLALDDQALSAIEEVLEVWCGQIETMLADDSIDRCTPFHSHSSKLSL